MRQTRSNSGFSLIELLVVVGIIALLLGSILTIPWSNLTRYARTSAIDQIESAAASARMIAMERGRTAAVIFTQSNVNDAAFATVVVESDTSGTFNIVDGLPAVQLPRGTTIRAPASSDTNVSSLYQTNSGPANGSPGSPPDNSVVDGLGTKNVKCFAVGFDNQGRLLTTGKIKWLNPTHNSGVVPTIGSTVASTDLIYVPYSPYALIIDTRTLVDASALCFTNGQSSEDGYLRDPNNASRVKIVAFNRYSGNALRK